MGHAAAMSCSPVLGTALDEVVGTIRRGLEDSTPDLLFVFCSHDHADGFDGLAAELVEGTGAEMLVGCTAEMVAGGDEEIEEGPVLSVLAVQLPGATIEPFHVEFGQTADGIMTTGMPGDRDAEGRRVDAVFLFADPFTSAPHSVIERLEAESPGVPLWGGMASGGVAPGTNRLFLGDRSLDHGGVGVAVHGAPGIASVVSQGCRPIDEPYVVTRSEQNLVLELGGMPALERLRGILPKLAAADRELVEHGLHLGIAISEYQDRFNRGDFLIANVMGADGDAGALVLGNSVRIGQTVQFHVRDAGTADEDLRLLLGEHREGGAGQARAVLLVTCNGRGTRLFDRPHHDAATIQQALGPMPLAGFFAQGELGPIGDRNFVHGFTASVVCFE